MPRLRRAQDGASPLLATLFLMGSAVLLGGGFLLARSFSDEGSDATPDVGLWADEGHDRLLVVLGDPEADWRRLELRTDRPAMASLDGPASLSHGTSSPGVGYVALGSAPRAVVGGDALALCAIGLAGPLEVTLRDGETGVVLFQQTLSVAACDA